MRVIGLIVPILLVPLALKAQVPYGEPVTAIAIEGASESVLEFLPIEPGDTLNPEAVRSAFQYLYQTGSYGHIELVTAAEANGTRLTFNVTPPYFFATIRVRPERLLERPLSSYTPLPYGERFSRNALDEIVEALREQFEAEGYFDEALGSSTETMGTQHPETIDIITSMADLFSNWDKPEKAKEYRDMIPVQLKYSDPEN